MLKKCLSVSIFLFGKYRILSALIIITFVLQFVLGNPAYELHR